MSISKEFYYYWKFFLRKMQLNFDYWLQEYNDIHFRWSMVHAVKHILFTKHCHTILVILPTIQKQIQTQIKHFLRKKD